MADDIDKPYPSYIVLGMDSASDADIGKFMDSMREDSISRGEALKKRLVEAKANREPIRVIARIERDLERLGYVGH